MQIVWSIKHWTWGTTLWMIYIVWELLELIILQNFMDFWCRKKKNCVQWVEIVSEIFHNYNDENTIRDWQNCKNIYWKSCRLIHKNQTATSERVPRIWSKEITIWQEMFYSYSNKSLLVINCCHEALPQNKK